MEVLEFINIFIVVAEEPTQYADQLDAEGFALTAGRLRLLATRNQEEYIQDQEAVKPC